jgi:hypothetical protein
MDQIEDLILTSANVPLTPWMMVNADRLIVLLDSLRDHLPEDIQIAKQVVEQQDDMLEQTRQQAIALLQEAQDNRHRLLSESELMHAIQEEAERVRVQLIHELEHLKQETLSQCEALRRDAMEEAEAIRASAKQYAANVLEETEARLGDMHQQVRSGVQQLQYEATHHDARYPSMNRGASPQRSVKRQPRPKIASQQAPLMSTATTSDEQVQQALRMLNTRK